MESDKETIRLGQSVAPSDLSAAQRATEPRAAGEEWERILKFKTAPSMQRPIEEARPFGQHERTPTFLRWVRFFWARRWSKRKSERITSDIHETQANLQAFMTMAQYAINLAVKTEKRPEARLTRRRVLMDRWRNTYGQVFGRVMR
jgi:hypothetical protein